LVCLSILWFIWYLTVQLNRHNDWNNISWNYTLTSSHWNCKCKVRKKKKSKMQKNLLWQYQSSNFGCTFMQNDWKCWVIITAYRLKLLWRAEGPQLEAGLRVVSQLDACSWLWLFGLYMPDLDLSVSQLLHSLTLSISIK